MFSPTLYIVLLIVPLTYGQWTWLNGEMTTDVPPVYGSVGSNATNNPGSRYNSVVWLDANDNFYMFGGSQGHTERDFSDIWKYDGTNWTWIWPANSSDAMDAPTVFGPRYSSSSLYNPGSRYSCAQWQMSDGSIWIYGGQAARQGSYPYFSDIWRLSIVNDVVEWAWMGGSQTVNTSTTIGRIGIEDPNTSPGARCWTVNWQDENENLYIFGGYNARPKTGATNDMFMYNITSGLWAFIAGSTFVRSTNFNYGEKGIASSLNHPPARYASFQWTVGNTVYVYGGLFDGFAHVLADLWMYNNNTWTFVSGYAINSSLDFPNNAPVYGAYATADVTSFPGSRALGQGWVKNGTELWMVCGTGSTALSLRDVFRYDIGSDVWTWLGGPENPFADPTWPQKDIDVSETPASRTAPAIAINKELTMGYFFGGANFFYMTYNDLWKINISKLGSPISTSTTTTTTGEAAAIESGKKSSSNSATIAIAVAVPIGVIAIIGAILVFLFIKRRSIAKEKKDGSEVEQANDRSSGYTSVLELRKTTVSSFANHQIVIQELLGSGNFGEVYKGLRDGQPVALKKLKSAEGWAEFQKEVNVLCALQHKNIVQYLGVHNDERRNCFIVTELMTAGDLKSVLLNDKTLIFRDLMLMVYDAARGMVYLHGEKNLIHRDLALRNLLASSGGDDGRKYTVKVSDFGMAKLLTTDSNYYTSESNHHPIKWCAVETLKFGKYSLQTDIWAFGVLLWEVFSYGETPYAGRTNAEACEEVLNGYRLEQPKDCPESMYNLMLDCWNVNPKERPTMPQIAQRIESILKGN